jgi:hypothetical protein
VPLPSHLTSCTPTKSNLYLDSSLETVIREPALYDDIDTINRNTETLIDASKEVDIKVNVEKTRYMLVLVTRLQTKFGI